VVATAQKQWPAERLLGSAQILRGSSTCSHSFWHFSAGLSGSAFLAHAPLASFATTW
jgi:hypothetical protein